jgi:hypothetical protein
MKKLKTFLPYILAGGLFFAGRWTGPDNSKELTRKYELERKYHLNEISKLNAALVDRDSLGLRIMRKMHEDSLKTAIDLRANKEAYGRLKKKYNEINLNRASSAQLDSLVEVLFSN